MEFYRNISLQDLPNEKWRSVKGYEGLYQVSNLGRIKGMKKTIGRTKKMLRNEKMLRQSLKRTGYLAIALRNNIGERKDVLVHRLVIMAFIPNIENKPQTNHKNGIKTINMVENLEWATRSENMTHAYKNGLMVKTVRGEMCSYAKLNNNDIMTIRELYSMGNLTQDKIAEMFLINRTSVSHIVNNKTWKHI